MNRKAILLLILLGHLAVSKSQYVDFDSYPFYKGHDLGLTLSSTRASFRIWSPVADKAEVLIYKEGFGGEAMMTIPMKTGANGTWTAILSGNHKGEFYAFRVQINGKWSYEVPDPYAKVVGINGKRAMIADLKETNPPGWQKDKGRPLLNAVDAVIYELHIRDASIADNSGIVKKGKYSGLTETGTKNDEGFSTGLDHLKELGVTHVHLLPFFDFNSIDETKPATPQYNWGYDPLNYNAPEGSYSSNANDGTTRIKELKTLIKAFHENGLNIVMDVVYNHTAETEKSNFNQLVPGYYYRQAPDGKFSNATACGNETASERKMVRKFMLESMIYWMREYHIDGFRIDLMGVHDIETINIISKELHKLKPGILLYGEGWTAGTSPLPDAARAIKLNAGRLDHVAVFSDDLRDGIKGSVFDGTDRGFASGKEGLEESIKFGVVAACKHPQVAYSEVNYSKAPYAKEPSNTVSYCECHDNHTLWDKLMISAKNNTEQERREMQKLALSIVLTSQGICFLHAGTEFLRTKKGVENSFQSPDSINAIDWKLKTVNRDVFDFVRALITMRKNHPAFRITTAVRMTAAIKFVDALPHNIVAYSINGAAVNDSWKKVFIIYNGSGSEQEITLPAGAWQLFSEGNKIITGKVTGKIKAKPWSCSILYRI